MKTQKELKKEARDEAKQDVKMYIAMDYDIKEETPEYFLLEKSTATFGKHVLVFFLTFWFTYGIGNLIYHFVAKKTKKVLK